MQRSIVGLLLASSILSCSSNESNPVAGCPTDTAGIQSTLLGTTCATEGCHSTKDQAEGLDLQSPGVEGRLVGVPAAACEASTLVVAGDPDASFLFQKVAQSKPKCGSHMPLGSTLDASQVACLKQWISGLPVHDAGSDVSIDAPSCPAGETACGGACIDLTTNVAHCGKCDTACGAGASCTGGKCVCGSGLSACASGCTDVASDVKNCGTCGMACASGTVCAASKCASSCPSGTTNCGGSCVDTSKSALNCGACGKTCPASTTCVGGACTCTGGLALCGSSCVNTQSDAANCGTCGKACGAGQVCSAGACSCGASVSFGAQVQPIFTASCARSGCHAGAKPASSLNLSAGSAYAALVGKASSSCSAKIRVTPGAVDKSYLVNKLTGVGMCSGTQMPKTGVSLATSQLDLIRGWICSGAPNN